MGKPKTPRPVPHGPLPSAGGSYIRGKDGELTKVPHPKADEQPAGEPATEPPATDLNSDQQTSEGGE